MEQKTNLVFEKEKTNVKIEIRPNICYNLPKDDILNRNGILCYDQQLPLETTHDFALFLKVSN